MAKAIYQRNQKVWVESVGVWAMIEKIVPVWAKGFDEPVRVTYDVGLGREFLAHELKPEQESGAEALGAGAPPWRLMRATCAVAYRSDGPISSTVSSTTVRLVPSCA